jgi:dihydrofolate reductase
MAKLVLHMFMSLDGFITGPHDGIRDPLGRNGHCLHDWLQDGTDPASHRPTVQPSATVFDEMMATGAVIAGRGTFDFAGGWNGDHHDGVPVFVPPTPTRRRAPSGHVTFVTDGIQSCVRRPRPPLATET